MSWSLSWGQFLYWTSYSTYDSVQTCWPSRTLKMYTMLFKENPYHNHSLLLLTFKKVKAVLQDYILFNVILAIVTCSEFLSKMFLPYFIVSVNSHLESLNYPSLRMLTAMSQLSELNNQKTLKTVTLRSKSIKGWLWVQSHFVLSLPAFSHMLLQL